MTGSDQVPSEIEQVVDSCVDIQKSLAVFN